MRSAVGMDLGIEPEMRAEAAHGCCGGSPVPHLAIEEIISVEVRPEPVLRDALPLGFSYTHCMASSQARHRSASAVHLSQ